LFIVVKKSRLVIGILLIAVITVGIVCAVVGAHAVSASAKERLLPIYGVATDENKVALSFDAAWGADKTEQLLDILDEYEVKTTFFLVGFWIDKYPDLVKEIAARGHLVGNHSATHPHFNTLSEQKAIFEVETTAKKIMSLTGQKGVQYFRAPFGEYNNTLLRLLEARDIKCIQWTVDSLDWKGLSALELETKVLGKVEKGSIVLFHNNSDHIVEALPKILAGLKAKKLQAVRMDELVLNGSYRIDNNGIQIAN